MSEENGGKLTDKQHMFVLEYVKDFNATQAAIRAGYSGKTAHSIGTENLRKPAIKEALDAFFDEHTMQSGEVLMRLTQHARGDFGDFYDPATESIDMKKAKEEGRSHLVRKMKQITIIDAGRDTETHITEFELYDAQKALALLGKQHGLFIDRTDITTLGEKLPAPLVYLPSVTPDDDHSDDT